ncbi:MAG: S8 family serine peptidase [Candidatus Limnocylindrales bacterium]
MSLRDAGSDDGNCGSTNGDAEHQAICRSVAAGVTYAVAAGNDRTNASQWIPAAYPEVITVSALADFNGKPGGGAPSTCSSFSSADVDDTFADFSNYGAAVDLIAPGKCIYSTYPTNKSTGTGYAGPVGHVDGDAARRGRDRPVQGRSPCCHARRGPGRPSGRWHARLVHQDRPRRHPRATPQPLELPVHRLPPPTSRSTPRRTP